MALAIDNKEMHGLYKGQDGGHRIGEEIVIGPEDSKLGIVGLSVGHDEVHIRAYFNHEAMDPIEEQATIAHLVMVRMTLDDQNLRPESQRGNELHTGELTFLEQIARASNDRFGRPRRNQGSSDQLSYYFGVNAGRWNQVGDRHRYPFQQHNALLKQPQMGLNQLRAFSKPFGNTHELNVPIREVGEALFAWADINLDLSHLSTADSGIEAHALLDQMHSDQSPLHEKDDFPAQSYVELILRYEQAFKTAGIEHNRYFQFQVFQDLGIMLLRGTFHNGIEQIRAFKANPSNSTVSVSQVLPRQHGMSIRQFLQLFEESHVGIDVNLSGIDAATFTHDMNYLLEWGYTLIPEGQYPTPPQIQPVSEDRFLVRFFIQNTAHDVEEQIHLILLTGEKFLKIFSFDVSFYEDLLNEYFDEGAEQGDALGIVTAREYDLDQRQSASQRALLDIQQADSSYFTSKLDFNTNHLLVYTYIIMPCLYKTGYDPLVLPGSFEVRFDRTYYSESNTWSSFSHQGVDWINPEHYPECQRLLTGAWHQFTDEDASEDDPSLPGYDHESTPYLEDGFKPLDEMETDE